MDAKQLEILCGSVERWNRYVAEQRQSDSAWRPDLRGVDLSNANPSNANLKKTCLAQVSGCTPAALSYWGWDVRGQYVHGWRTTQSIHVGNAVYVPSETYTAPYLSCSRETVCHPGIYMLQTWAGATENDPDIVQCRAHCSDVVLINFHRSKGIRVQRLEVLP